jgi:hypothetical protein
VAILCAKVITGSVTADDADLRLEFCEWVKMKVDQDAQSLGIIFWTDEVTFTVNGIVIWHSYVYWSAAYTNVYVDKTVHL